MWTFLLILLYLALSEQNSLTSDNTYLLLSVSEHYINYSEGRHLGLFQFSFQSYAVDNWGHKSLQAVYGMKSFISVNYEEGKRQRNCLYLSRWRGEVTFLVFLLSWTFCSPFSFFLFLFVLSFTIAIKTCNKITLKKINYCKLLFWLQLKYDVINFGNNENW